MEKESKELKLNEIQKIMLEQLIFFHQLCEKQNFVYYLAYGTLIGAVRHKGFIPWDDDVDVWMPRKDYDAFVSYCEMHENEIIPYRIVTRKNLPGYQYGIARLSNQDYKYEVTGTDNQIDIGVFIDVYPLDNFGNSLAESKSIYLKTMLLNSIYWTYIGKKGTHPVLTILKLPVRMILRLIFGKHYNLRIDSQVYGIIKKNTRESDLLIGCPVWEPAAFSKKYFDDRIVFDFSGHSFYGPIGYDGLLRSIYGDYMQLPPKEKRIPQHNYRIFRRHE